MSGDEVVLSVVVANVVGRFCASRAIVQGSQRTRGEADAGPAQTARAQARAQRWVLGGAAGERSVPNRRPRGRNRPGMRWDVPASDVTLP